MREMPVCQAEKAKAVAKRPRRLQPPRLPCRGKPVGWLQDMQETEHQESTDGKANSHDEQRRHELGRVLRCCVVGAPEDSGQHQREFRQDGRFLMVCHAAGLYARTTTSTSPGRSKSSRHLVE